MRQQNIASRSLLRVLLVLPLCYLSLSGPAVEHPFLLVKSSEFSALQSLAAGNPWAGMKAAALKNALLQFDTSKTYQGQCWRLSEMMSANALCYILDPNNRATYKNRIVSAFAYWNNLYGGLYTSPGDWNRSVPPGTAYFNSALAYDIVYNSMSTSERSTCLKQLSRVGEYYWAHNGNHVLNISGVRGMWALLQGNQQRVDSAKAAYRAELLSTLTTDGVYNEGPGYGADRLGSLNERDAKEHFLDVLEFTGQDHGYYSNTQIRNFNEWLYGYSLTPFKYNFTFGDSIPKISPLTDGSGAYRAYRFTTKAATLAAFAIQDAPAPGYLIPYILQRAAPQAPSYGSSRLFSNGGAWFRERSSAETALAGALWNPKTSFWHSHKDVNALNLVGYGEYLLQNSGYNGWGNGALGFSWNYIHDRAVSSNTVLINYPNTTTEPSTTNDHAAKAGAGIAEGFTGMLLDYACGDSGSALPNGTHQRSLVFIHPQNGCGGYWTVFDEVHANVAGATAHAAFHPGSDAVTTLTGSTEYNWTINRLSGHAVALTTFLGTAPQKTELKNGVLASTTGSIAARYLYLTYPTDSLGDARFANVFFPSDGTYAKPSLARIASGQSNGSRATFGNGMVDSAMISPGTAAVTTGTATFTGKACLFRQGPSALCFYFVRKGTSFSSSNVGFTANQPSSIFMCGGKGVILSAGATVTFRNSGVYGVKANGVQLTALATGTGWVKVTVPAGRVAIELTGLLPVNNG
jgi:hypothetical protein